MQWQAVNCPEAIAVLAGPRAGGLAASDAPSGLIFERFFGRWLD
jgi:hypothetical protein